MFVLQFGLFKTLSRWGSFWSFLKFASVVLETVLFPRIQPLLIESQLKFVNKNFFYFQEETSEVSEALLAESKPEKPKIGLKPKLEKPKSKIPRSVVAEPATVVESDSSNNNGIKTR